MNYVNLVGDETLLSHSIFSPRGEGGWGKPHLDDKGESEKSKRQDPNDHQSPDL